MRFNIGDIVDGLKIVGLATIEGVSHYATKFETNPPVMYPVNTFDEEHYKKREAPVFPQEELQAASKEIAAHVAQMQNHLWEAQTLADKYGLSFAASLDTRSGKEWNDYDDRYARVDGTYYGKGNTDYTGDEPLEEGMWGWETSSLSC